MRNGDAVLVCFRAAPDGFVCMCLCVCFFGGGGLCASYSLYTPEVFALAVSSIIPVSTHSLLAVYACVRYQTVSPSGCSRCILGQVAELYGLGESLQRVLFARVVCTPFFREVV